METGQYPKGTIISIDKNPPLSKYIQGTIFGPGDYYYTEPSTYTVHVEGEEDFTVNKDAIMKNFPERKNVTDNRLKELVGKDANILR